MINPQDSNIKDSIRLSESNIDDMTILKIGHTGYISEDCLNSFAESNNITNKNNIIKYIYENNYGMTDINILNRENTKGNIFNETVDDILYIFETIDVGALRSMEKGGPGKLMTYINKAAAFLTKQKYDEEDIVKRNIKKCEDLLKDIEEEKDKVANNEANSSYRFTASYIASIAASVASALILPIITKNPTKAAIGGAGLVAGGVPNDVKKLVLSVTDYNKLLNHYDAKISNIKADYERKLDAMQMEGKKEDNKPSLKDSISDKMKSSGNMPQLKPAMESNMGSLREFEAIPANQQTTQFVSPKEIESKYANPGNVKIPENREVLHDDDVEDDAPIQAEEEPELPQRPTFTPYDAVNKYKCDPKNVPLAKYNDRYYLTYGDLKNYMDRTNSVNYRDTVDSIIKVNDTPDLNNDNLSVIMSASELENCSLIERTRIENSDVTFDIYK